MKIKTLNLNYFKRFEHLKLDFTDEAGFPKNLIVLIGNNGTGKTSILQAIAQTIGTAAGRPFDWPSFDTDLAYKNWAISPGETIIECEISFEEDELAAIRECYFLSNYIGPQPSGPPGSVNSALLRYFSDGSVKGYALHHDTTFEDQAVLAQVSGRKYATQVLRQHPRGRDILRRLGSIFWYTEQRVNISLTQWDGEAGFDVNTLRQRLSEWQNLHLQVKQGSYQLRPNQRDLYAELQDTYQRLFPDRGFVGTIPRDAEAIAETSWFLMSQSDKQYEISEMSAGEQAIFPVLFDFVNWEIHRSVILIDEIGLHLHPPLQQAFVRGLQSLGSDNQFIITTHSEDVLAAVPDSSVIRLKG